MQKQGVDGMNQRGTGTPVDVEGVPDRCSGGRTHIGEHISASESIDRLFWITHYIEDTSRVVIICVEDLSEYFVLKRVGILKLINERSPILASHALYQFCSIFALKGLVQINKQIVEVA